MPKKQKARQKKSRAEKKKKRQKKKVVPKKKRRAQKNSRRQDASWDYHAAVIKSVGATKFYKWVKKKRRMSQLLLSRCEVQRAKSHQLSLS